MSEGFQRRPRYSCMSNISAFLREKTSGARVTHGEKSSGARVTLNILLSIARPTGEAEQQQDRTKRLVAGYDRRSGIASPGLPWTALPFCLLAWGAWMAGCLAWAARRFVRAAHYGCFITQKGLANPNGVPVLFTCSVVPCNSHFMKSGNFNMNDYVDVATITFASTSWAQAEAPPRQETGARKLRLDPEPSIRHWGDAPARFFEWSIIRRLIRSQPVTDAELYSAPVIRRVVGR
jgi:hypothetical protein